MGFGIAAQSVAEGSYIKIRKNLPPKPDYFWTEERGVLGSSSSVYSCFLVVKLVKYQPASTLTHSSSCPMHPSMHSQTDSRQLSGGSGISAVSERWLLCYSKSLS